MLLGEEAAHLIACEPRLERFPWNFGAKGARRRSHTAGAPALGTSAAVVRVTSGEVDQVTTAVPATAQVVEASLEERFVDRGAEARRGAVEVDDATLAGCRMGDPAALRVFVGRYQELVFAFLSRSVGRGPHVEDLAQEVFLRACRALPRFDPAGSARPSTWLLTIATRLVVDARRRRAVPTSTLDTDVPSPATGTPETERRRLEIGRALEAAAAELSPDHRDVFLLAEFHGLDTREIAGVVGVPEGTVRTRLFRARAHLRALLKDLWESLT